MPTLYGSLSELYAPKRTLPLEQVKEVVGNMIPKPYCTYLSAEKVEDEDNNVLLYPSEMLNTLAAGSALSDHKLKLKKGFIVMIIRNLDPNKD